MKKADEKRAREIAKDVVFELMAARPATYPGMTATEAASTPPPPGEWTQESPSLCKKSIPPVPDGPWQKRDDVELTGEYCEPEEGKHEAWVNPYNGTVSAWDTGQKPNSWSDDGKRHILRKKPAPPKFAPGDIIVNVKDHRVRMVDSYQGAQLRGHRLFHVGTECLGSEDGWEKAT